MFALGRRLMAPARASVRACSVPAAPRACIRRGAVGSRRVMTGRLLTSAAARGVGGSFRMAMRRFSTEVGSATKKELSQLERIKLQLPTYGAIAGGLVIVYGVSKTVMYITNTFMSVNFSTVAYVSFVAGFGAAVVCAGMFATMYRMITIRPEPVFRRALSLVRGNPEAAQLLGRGIKSGKLRAYVLRTGRFGLDSTSGKLTWLRPRVRMLFQVHGSEREGMVCVEGTRNIGSLRKVHVSMLSVDVVRSSGEPTIVLVTGDADDLKIRGQLRRFLQAERVQYIEHPLVDELEDDDD